MKFIEKLQSNIGFFYLQIIYLIQLYLLHIWNVDKWITKQVIFLWLWSIIPTLFGIILLIISARKPKLQLPKPIVHHWFYQASFFLLLISSTVVVTYWIELILQPPMDYRNPKILLFGKAVKMVGEYIYSWATPVIYLLEYSFIKPNL